MIELLKTGDYAYPQIAEICNVPNEFVTSIANHYNWKYLTNGIIFPPPKMSGRKNVKLTEEDIPKIIEMFNCNMSNDEICLQFGVTPKTISDIRNHKTWRTFTGNMKFIRSPKYKGVTPLRQKIIDYLTEHPDCNKNIIGEEIGASRSMVWDTYYKFKHVIDVDK